MQNFLSTEWNEPKAWNAFALSHPASHLLQSYEWGQLKSEFGWSVRRLVTEDGDQPVAGAQMLLRPLPVGAMAYLPRGPLLEPDDVETADVLLPAIHRVAEHEGAIFLRVEPSWRDDPALADQMRRWGFRPAPSIQPRSTISLSLKRDEDDLLMDMKSKTRYNIRLAGRKDVVVREGEGDDLATFYHLLKTTSERQEFAIHTQDYYEKAWHTFAEADRTALFLAYYEEEILAGLMVFAFGDTASYLYGASSNRHRNRMPTYLLQWEAIRWAKAKGCDWYDLWGIPDEVGEAIVNDEDVERGQGGMWGVYRFKRGFGGQVVRYVGAWDYVYRPVLYWLVTKMIALRRLQSWGG